jgi:uridine phosphorylase
MDDDTPLVTPQEYISYVCKRQGWNRDEVSLLPTVIVAAPFFLRLYKRSTHAEKVEKTIAKNHHKIPEFNVSLVEARLGAPLMAIDMEIMIALNASRFIYLAFAGSIRDDVNVGDIIITKGVLNETGIPRLYAVDDFFIPSDPSLTNALENAAQGKDVKTRSGTSWCTDAPYRETWGKVKRFVDQEALCVEMEGAALFTLSTYYGVPAAAVYVITDTVGEKGWVQSWHTMQVFEGCKNVLAFMDSFIRQYHPDNE